VTPQQCRAQDHCSSRNSKCKSQTTLRSPSCCRTFFKHDLRHDMTWQSSKFF